MRGTGRVYTVEDGDTLFEIARHELGKPSRWAEIYDLNRDVLGNDFDYLRPGIELILPDDKVARRKRHSPAEQRVSAVAARFGLTVTPDVCVGGSLIEKLIQCLEELRRARIVVIGAGDDDKLLRLVGRGEQLAAQFDRHDRVGVAVNLQQRAVIFADRLAGIELRAHQRCTGSQG